MDGFNELICDIDSDEFWLTATISIILPNSDKNQYKVVMLSVKLSKDMLIETLKKLFEKITICVWSNFSLGDSYYYILKDIRFLRYIDKTIEQSEILPQENSKKLRDIFTYNSKIQIDSYWATLEDEISQSEFAYKKAIDKNAKLFIDTSPAIKIHSINSDESIQFYNIEEFQKVKSGNVLFKNVILSFSPKSYIEGNSKNPQYPQMNLGILK